MNEEVIGETRNVEARAPLLGEYRLQHYLCMIRVPNKFPASGSINETPEKELQINSTTKTKQNSVVRTCRPGGALPRFFDSSSSG